MHKLVVSHGEIVCTARVCNLITTPCNGHALNNAQKYLCSVVGAFANTIRCDYCSRSLVTIYIPEYVLTFLNNAHSFIPIPWVEGLHAGTQVASGLNTHVRTSWSHNSQGLHARS